MDQLADMLRMSLAEIAESTFLVPYGDKFTAERIEDRIYMELPAAGISFAADADDERVISIFLYSDGFQGYQGFAGVLPNGLSYSDSRKFVQDRLGAPTASGGGKPVAFFGMAPVWDRYDRASYSLHIRYTADEDAISLVTVMRPDRVPR